MCVFTGASKSTSHAISSQAFLRGGRPLLLGSGMSPAEVDELEANSHRELDESKFSMLIRLQMVYARKKAG